MAKADAVVGLDLASSAGWAVFALDGKLIASGTWSVSKAGTDYPGDRWILFETSLSSLLDEYRVLVVAMEMPVVWREIRWSTARVLFGQAATAERVCARRCIETVMVPPSEIKKRTTGKGNASKEAVIDGVVAETGPLSVEPLACGSTHARDRRLKLRSDEADARGAVLWLLDNYDRDALARGELVKR